MKHYCECIYCDSHNYYNFDDILNDSDVKFICWNCGQEDYVFPNDIHHGTLDNCTLIDTYPARLGV